MVKMKLLKKSMLVLSAMTLIGGMSFAAATKTAKKAVVKKPATKAAKKSAVKVAKKPATKAAKKSAAK